jgi:hypothetical protein
VLRQHPDGIYVYGPQGRRAIAVEPHRGRTSELIELYEAVTQDRPDASRCALGNGEHRNCPCDPAIVARAARNPPQAPGERMSQILGMGLTHYPGLLVPPDNWPRMLKRGVEIGRIPADLYADHARWPKRCATNGAPTKESPRRASTSAGWSPRSARCAVRWIRSTPT